MSLYQLQDLASRHQEQIESTHRLMMTKEQRLNYLSSVRDNQQGTIFEFEQNVALFKEKVTLQETKLRKLRLLKGQIQQQRCANSNMCSEVESCKILFKEKERELSVAFAKIDSLTRQLDELKKGNTANSYNIGGYKHAAELEKLRQELLYKTKIGKQNDEEIIFKRNLAYKRKAEMLKMDKKISELQCRLARKRQLNQLLSTTSSSPSSSSLSSTTTTTAATLGLSSARGNTEIITDNGCGEQAFSSGSKTVLRSSIIGHPTIAAPSCKSSLVTSNYSPSKNGATGVFNNNNNNNTNNIATVEPLQRFKNGALPFKYADFPSDFAGFNNNNKSNNNGGGNKTNVNLALSSQSKSDSKYQTLPYNTKFLNRKLRTTNGGQGCGSSNSNSSYAAAKNLINNDDDDEDGDDDDDDDDDDRRFDEPISSAQSSTISTATISTDHSENHCRQLHNMPSSNDISLIIHQHHHHHHHGNRRHDDHDPADNDDDDGKDTSLEERPSPSGSSGSSDRISSSLMTAYSYSGGGDKSVMLSNGINGLCSTSSTASPSAHPTAADDIHRPPHHLHRHLHSNHYFNSGRLLDDDDGDSKHYRRDESPKMGKNQRLISESNAQNNNTNNNQKNNILYSPSSESFPYVPNLSALGGNLSNVDPKEISNLNDERNSSKLITPSVTTNSTTATTTSSSGLDSFYKTKPSVPVKPVQPSSNNNNDTSDSSSAADHIDNCRYDANFLYSQRSQRSSSENSSLSTPSSGVFSSSDIFSPNGSLALVDKNGNHDRRSSTANEFSKIHPNDNTNDDDDDDDDDDSDENEPNDADNLRNSQIEERSTSVSEIVHKINSWSIVNNVSGAGGAANDWEKTKRRPVVVSTNEMEQELMNSRCDDNANRDGGGAILENQQFQPHSKLTKNSIDVSTKNQSLEDFANNNNIGSINENNHNNNNKVMNSTSVTSDITSNPTNTTTTNTMKNNETRKNDMTTATTPKSKRIKGSLKCQDPNRGVRKIPLGRRVSFDPLALLLDASLEGELELVKKTSIEVPNPSASNDEGITALHNATCAGHFEIVKYLVEIGCDVNVQDSDGWTPLHCAASCNNLGMIKFLVKSGACIFATTFSDQETAAEKCEEDEEGFDGCSQYLYGVQDQLGAMNGGVVYALYDYDSQNADELNFRNGDCLQVLRKGDDQEKEWWWSRHSDQEGYVARNLIGLYPRIKPSLRSDS